MIDGELIQIMLNQKDRVAVDAILSKRVPRKLVAMVAAVAKGEQTYEEQCKVPPLLCNLNDAARRLGVSRSRFWQLRKKGLVPTVEMAGVCYVRFQDLDEVVMALRVKEVTA